MNQYQTSMLEKQDIIIALLKKLIVVTSASAVASSSEVTSYARQDAAYYAKGVLDNGAQKGKYDEPY